MIDLFTRMLAHHIDPVSEWEARSFEGPHVYLVISREVIQYPLGRSHVAYIGHTDNPARRFIDHAHVHRFDMIALIPLQTVLREVKLRDPSWRTMGHHEGRNIRLDVERLYLHTFKRLLGALPIRNRRDEIPDRRSMLAAEVFLSARVSPIATLGRHSDRFGGHAILEKLRQLLPSDMQTKRTDRGSMVLSSSRVQHVIVRPRQRHCRVRLRCSHAWGNCSNRGHARSRNASGWLGAERIDDEQSLREFLKSYKREWGA